MIRGVGAPCNMTNKKVDCGCLFPLFPCLFSLNPDDIVRKQHSHEIDRQLARDKKEFVKTHRLLLLGAGESGKSTIIKQMQLIHVDKFSETVRSQRRDDIRNNLADAIFSILAAMPVITPPIKLDNAEHETMAKWILDHASKQDFDYPSQFYEYTKILWQDKGVQKTFERSNEYQLIDSAKYFFERIDVISKDNYVPTDHDILRCRVLTTGIYELKFQIEDIKFQIIDVGGQRNERRKWFLCFNGVSAIIFVAACSSYNMVLREDPSKNRLQESLELFKVVWNNRWLCHISVIAFLNKEDLFREKILSGQLSRLRRDRSRCTCRTGRSKLEDYFPAFRNFTVSDDPPRDHPEVHRAKHFIKNEFQNITMMGKNFRYRRFFPHFTCAVDTQNIKRVFDDCRENIQWKYLSEYDLI